MKAFLFSLLLFLTSGIVWADELPHWNIYGVWKHHVRNQEVPKEFLENPDLVGCSLGTYWYNIEPEENKFDWSYLDSQIKSIQEHQKLVNLRLFAGNFTPKWVMDKGVAAFVSKGDRGWRSSVKEGTKTPVPWNEIYLTEWEKFVRVLGERYGNQIAMINVTGPNRSTAEMHLVYYKNPYPDIQQWIQLGYSPEKLIGAWKRCIDVFAESFPKSYVVINTAGRAVKPDDGVIEGVCGYGYQKLGKRLLIQNNAICAKKDLGRSDFPIILKYADQGVITGFQMLWFVAGDQLNRMQGTLKEAIQNGLEMKAKYLEIYPADILAFPDDVKEAAAKLKKKEEEMKSLKR